MTQWQFYEGQDVEVDEAYRVGRFNVPPDWQKAKIVNYRPMDTDYFEVEYPNGIHVVFDTDHIRSR